jgi:hypothetical protein
MSDPYLTAAKENPDTEMARRGRIAGAVWVNPSSLR